MTVGKLLADDRRRNRLRRSARVWRLTMRRGAHFALMRVRGARADEEAKAKLEEQFVIRTAEDVARELGQMKGAIMKAGQMLSFIARRAAARGAGRARPAPGRRAADGAEPRRAGRPGGAGRRARAAVPRAGIRCRSPPRRSARSTGR